MKIQKNLIGLTLILLLIFAVGLVNCYAQKKISVSGEIKFTFTKAERFNIGDVEGHTFSITESAGTNRNIGSNVFMDGAKVTHYGFSDMIKGNGPQQGYNIFVTDDGSFCVKYEGKVKTTFSSEEMEMTTFEGKYTYTGGTGQYENIQGKGTYAGSFTSEKDYTVNWEGKYHIK
ncbi:MAG: hypothetical protein JW917_08850 [Ignavibacteria bacterium]|nr:hypothetical protein [Ignavibacteria bacterium]